MKINVLAFGVARDILGGSTAVLTVGEGATVAELKRVAEEAYPRLRQLASYMVAVNSEYADDGMNIRADDEIAIIPPVSGG